MKNLLNSSIIFLALVLLGLTFPNEVLAGGTTTTYYARLKAQVSGNSTGMGKVYAGNTNSAGTYDAPSSTSSNNSTTTNGGSLNFYAFAQPNDGYVFEGWSNSDNNRTFASTANPYTVAVSATSTKSGTPTEKTVYAVFKEAPMANITFKKPTNGSYSYMSQNDGSGESLTPSTPADKVIQSKDKFTLTATAADGYQFVHWKKTVSANTSFFGGNPVADIQFAEDAVVEAVFVPDNYAIFTVDGVQFADLNEANTAALASSGKTIVATKDGIVAAGNYTISSGVKLTIPFSSANSFQTSPDEEHQTSATACPALTPYRIVTLQSGVNITLQGGLCIGGRMASVNGGNPSGFPTGACGILDMSKGGHIDVENGGVIYAWGFIQGQNYLEGNNTQNVGTITAKNGSAIYEDYSLSDWGGGSYSTAVGSNSKSYRIYPFQGYYDQNIEVPLRFEYGATETLYTKVYASSSTTTVNNIPFIGNGTKVLFKINSAAGAVTKWYDATTDHLVVELEGDAAINDMQMSLYITVKASDFDLPLMSNMHFKLKNCNLVITSPMKMQAGCIVEIPAGSSITMKSKFYVYDHDDWGTFVQKKYFRPNPGILTAYRSRGDGNTNTLEDAKIICDGQIIMSNGGGLYTTPAGADVMGNNGGTIQWESTLPANATTYGYSNGTGITGSSFAASLTAEYCIAANCTPAKAHNENGSYTAAKAATTFTNVHGRWFGGSAKNEKGDHTYDFTYLNGSSDVTTDAIYWLDAAGEGHWNNATTTDVTYVDTWKGTEEADGVNAYYCYTTYDAEGNNPQYGWVKLTRIGETANFGGSDNNMYVYLNDKWCSIGSTDANCLYTVSDVKVALVGGELIHVEVNDDPVDGAWHDGSGNYYVDLSGGACLWTPATKVGGCEKAYVIEGQTYIRFDEDEDGNDDWMAVEYEAPFYYTLDNQGLRTYYEYNTSSVAWQLATPKVSVTSNAVTTNYYFFADAFTAANNAYNPTITLLGDLYDYPTSERTFISLAHSTAYTIDLNGHTLTMTRTVSGTSTAGVGNRFLNITDPVTVTVLDGSLGQEGQIRCIATGNAYARGITVGSGATLNLQSGKLYVENNAPYSSNTSERVYAVVPAAGSTFNISGGEIEAASEYYAWCVVGSGSTSTPSTINMNGGTLTANAYYNAEGIYSTGIVNMTGGTINATTKAMFSKASGNQYAYGIFVNASANATASSAYHGKLAMTGGTINAYAVSNYAYGVYVNSASATASGGTANVSSAEAVISGGAINAESKTTTVYGVLIYGGPNSYGSAAKTVINGGTITARGTSTVYGIFVNASVADLTAAKLYGIAEINDCNVTATSTSSTSAYGVYATAASRMMNQTTYSKVSDSNKKTWYYSYGGTTINGTTSNTYKYQVGYYGCGGKVTINGGTFTANTKTYNAYGAYCAASTLRGAEDTTEPQVEGRAELTIHGGTFNANTTTYNAYGVFSSGTTVIDGGTFNPTTTTYGAYGAYADRGTMTITGGTYNATAETTTACGIGATGWIDGNRGVTSHAVVTVDGVTVTAKCKTKDTAYGVLANATNAELTAAKYAARSANDKQYYFTDATDATIANYYRYRIGSYAEGGDITINGGTFNVEVATTTAFGAYCASSALGHTTEVGYTAIGRGTLTINGGTFISETKGTTTAYGVRSYGNTTINGGTFTAIAKTTTAYGVRVEDGTTTVTDGTFNAIATTNTAYGVFANAEVETNYGYTREAVANIQGGTFNVETKGGSSAYGVYVNGTKKASFKPSKMASAETVTGDLAIAATTTITGGTFDVKASNNSTVYGVYVVGTQTQGTATASPKATILDGKFNINGATSSSGACNTSATAANFQITGGHYSSQTNLATYVVAPKHVVSCNHNDLKATYPYEVAEAYNITFKNGSTTLQEGYVKAGETPVYSGSAPTKSATAEYTYAFTGWSPAIAVVTGDATYVAAYSSSKRSYAVIFQDYDGTELQNTNVEYGQTPAYSGTPTRAATAEYTYTFDTWTPAITNVTGAATYTAVYTQTANSYTITFNSDGGSSVAPITQDYNTSVAPPADPVKLGYVFTGWSPAVPSVMPAENMTCVAQWEVDASALDIVEWTSSNIIINMNGSTQQVTIGDKTIAKGGREDDRTMVFPISETGLSPVAGGEITIVAKNKNGIDVESERTYQVPYIYESPSATLTDLDNDDAIIRVNSGKLTITGTVDVDKVYVNPGAELVVSGSLICKSLILRTDPWKAAAVSGTYTTSTPGDGEFNAAATFYTRIICAQDAYYHFGLPLASDINEVFLSNHASSAPYGSAWILKSYNGATRASNGADGNNWDYLDPAVSTTIAANVGYEMFSNTDYYREFYFPVNPATMASTITAKAYPSSKGSQHQGWNALVAPKMGRWSIDFVDPSDAKKVSLLEDLNTYYQCPATDMQPAVPFYYQNMNNVDEAIHFTVPAAIVARRVSEEEQPVQTQWLQLTYANASGIKDETNIYVNSDKFTSAYEAGYDVTKLSTSGTRPLLYTQLPCGDLAFTAIPDEMLLQMLPLTVYSPEFGQYTFSLGKNKFLSRLENVWIVDVADGSIIDLLQSDYTVNVDKGTTSARFYIMGKFGKPQITTDIDELDGNADENDKVRKIIFNEHLYILYKGHVWDASGRLVK